MSRSKEAIINEVLNKYTQNLADVGQCVHPLGRLGATKRQGFTRFSKMFCDSMVFWAPVNSADEKVKENSNGPYSAGFTSIKLSLYHCRAKKVVVAMVAILPVLRKRYLVLHDIDMTHDCRYVSTRTYLERHLKAIEGISTIVNDHGRVGDHCMTLFAPADNAQKIRCKVYNKPVQMLVSADVRKSLGSRMEDIVANPDEKFSRTLLRHRDHGLLRLELTFYGSRLHPLAVHQNRMDDARRLLECCTTFDYSYEQHWIERAELIKAMVAVYIPGIKVFAYCHWWNSTTRKKYGYMWSKVSALLAMHLVANYSFDDRPIYYVEAKVSENGTVEVTKEKMYEREPGCKAKTLVPGGSKEHRPDDGQYVKHMRNMHSSTFGTSYNVLEPGGIYTIAAAGLKEFRGTLYWHIIMDCGTRVRAGKSLFRSKGTNDMKCKLVQE
ncbi:hypothetical protein K457DRAFT_25176 [Linnemannia elongata AG-77]|uniref:Uncharacterized protein n=1 Tax=Linnemannia elongata AG-77 TaxID=1314771 RepID=A0A197JDS8_9FUNG|nr:hypothetical protein K457DRAFT_25176 [Linnemannia elongata AG-77]